MDLINLAVGNFYMARRHFYGCWIRPTLVWICDTLFRSRLLGYRVIEQSAISFIDINTLG